MSAIYRLRLLGPVQVERAGKPVRGFESHKALALLGYLSARRHPLNRSYLANLFWQDKSEARGRGNLSRVIHNLSSLLPDCLIADRDTIQFRCADTYWLDTRAFEELVERGEASAFDAAIELYRDEFMAGIFLDDCPEFETWLVTEREHWRQRVNQILQTLIAYHTQRGECAAGLRLAARWLDLDPWREEAHRQKMLLLALSGQRSDALAQYETCRRLLAQELGVEPTQATTTLSAQIRDGAIAPLPPPLVSPPHNLPAPLTPFVGRAEELSKIAERLANPDCRLVTLVGPGGIGKTRLALQAASANIHACADGVFLVPLAPVPSADLIVPAIAHALKLSLRGATDPQTQLLDYLRAKKMLLVLDSFEHLLPPACGGAGEKVTWLIEILRNAPQLKILVTSRERLNLQAEWLLEVEGLQYPKDEDARQTDEKLPASSFILHPSAFSAVQLFAQSAQRVHADFSLEAEWAGMLRICHLTRGMPLALELAATAARDFSCAAIAEEIDRNLSFLATTMRDVPERHRSVRAVFEHSWKLLSAEERRAFCRVSVFRGGFDVEAALEILNAESKIQNSTSEIPGSPDRISNFEFRISTWLTALVDKSLLRQDVSGRYEMHELVRQYAEEKLHAAGEAAAVRARHLQFYLALAEQAEPELRRPKQSAWLERLDEEHDNIRAALAWSVKNDADEAGLRLASALMEFWLGRGYLGEGRRWLEQLLAKSDRVPDALRASALSVSAGLALAEGSYKRAAALYHRVLALKKTQGDKAGIAKVLNNLGLIAADQADYEGAQMFHRESLAIKQELGDKHGTAGSYLNLGNVAWAEGDYARAGEWYERCLAARRELEDKRGVAFALGNLANIRSIQGDYAHAQALYESTLTLLRELKAKQGIANILGNLGLLARRQEEYERATALYTESLTLYQEMENKSGIAVCFEGLGGAACARGEMTRAAHLYGAAEAAHAAMGERKPPFDRVNYERDLATLRARLGAEEFAARWAEGHEMSLEQAIQYAMKNPVSNPSASLRQSL